MEPDNTGASNKLRNNAVVQEHTDYGKVHELLTMDAKRLVYEHKLAIRSQQLDSGFEKITRT